VLLIPTDNKHVSTRKTLGLVQGLRLSDTKVPIHDGDDDTTRMMGYVGKCNNFRRFGALLTHLYNPSGLLVSPVSKSEIISRRRVCASFFAMFGEDFGTI
jgi:hypothetical protein